MRVILLCLVLLSPSLWAQPKIAVTPDWGIASTLSSIGVEPLATGDLNSYPFWVAEPTLDHTINWGARYYPNRELLAGLDYDLVFDLPFYFHLRPLYGDKPVYAVAFKGEDELAPTHWQSYAAATQQIGDLLQAPENARRYLAEAKSCLAQWGRAIIAADKPRRYAVVQFADARNLRMYANNSQFHAALEQMGLSLYSPKGSGQWGNVLMTLSELAELPSDVCLLIIGPLSPMVEVGLERSYLWQRMGFRDGRCVHKLPPMWAFGGVDAVVRFGGLLYQAVMGDAP